MPLRTIGRLARDAGVGVETIRFYERRGLLTRPAVSPSRKFREYDDRAVALVRHIRLAQTLGFSLKEVARLVELTERRETFCGTFRNIVAEKLTLVTAEIERLDGLKAQLLEAQVRCAARQHGDECPILRNLGSQQKAAGQAIPSGGY
jgi:DNA-binding transcriptional MerR regulator